MEDIYITDEQKERLAGRIEDTFTFSSEQLDALAGITEMSYGLFKSCLEACLEVGNYEDYGNVMMICPELAQRYNGERAAEIHEALEDKTCENLKCVYKTVYKK